MTRIRAFLADLWGSTRDWVGSNVVELHIYPGIVLVGYAGYQVHEALGWGLWGALLLYLGLQSLPFFGRTTDEGA